MVGIVFEINRIRPRRRKRGLYEKAKIILLSLIVIFAIAKLVVTFRPLMERASRQKQVDEAKPMTASLSSYSKYNLKRCRVGSNFVYVAP